MSRSAGAWRFRSAALAASSSSTSTPPRRSSASAAWLRRPRLRTSSTEAPIPPDVQNVHVVRRVRALRTAADAGPAAALEQIDDLLRELEAGNWGFEVILALLDRGHLLEEIDRGRAAEAYRLAAERADRAGARNLARVGEQAIAGAGGPNLASERDRDRCRNADDRARARSGSARRGRGEQSGDRPPAVPVTQDGRAARVERAREDRRSKPHRAGLAPRPSPRRHVRR